LFGVFGQVPTLQCKPTQNMRTTVFQLAGHDIK
jgi:hypothetical protein